MNHSKTFAPPSTLRLGSARKERLWVELLPYTPKYVLSRQGESPSALPAAGSGSHTGPPYSVTAETSAPSRCGHSVLGISGARGKRGVSHRHAQEISIKVSMSSLRVG